MLETSFRGESESLAPARKLVADFTAKLGADLETIQRAQLVVSELATNAIQFASGQPFTLSLRRSNNAVSISVTSVGAASDIPRDGVFPPLIEGRLAVTRRGLAIAHAVCRIVDAVEHDDGTVTVTGELELG